MPKKHHPKKKHVEMMNPDNKGDGGKVPASSDEHLPGAVSPTSASVESIMYDEPAGPQLPSLDNDVDGDGQVSARDFAWARRFQADLSRPMSDEEMKAARDISSKNFPAKWNVHPQWDVLEEMVWENDPLSHIIEYMDEESKGMTDDVREKTLQCLFMTACQADAVTMMDEMYTKFPHSIKIEKRNQLKETPLMMAAGFGAILAMQWLIEHGASLNKSDINGRTAVNIVADVDVDSLVVLVHAGATISLKTFTNALKAALGRNSYNAAGFLFGFNHSTMNVGSFVRRLFRLSDQKNRASVQFVPDDFFDYCKMGLRMNKSPLVGCLKLSHVFRILARLDPANRKEYGIQYDGFDQQALALWHGIPDNVTASLVLEQQQPGIIDETVLDVALESGNTEFVTDARLNRIVGSWYQPYPFDISWFANDPGELFRTPVVKFALDVSSFVVFLFLFSLYMLQHIRIHEQVDYLEAGVMVYGIAYLLNEVQQVMQAGVNSYLNDAANRFDLAMCGAITILFICRVPSYSARQEANLDVLYIGTVCVMCLAIWLRSLFLFTVIPSLGPLLLTLRKMVLDVVNFGVIFMVFIVGFFFAFDFLISGKYSTLGPENYQSKVDAWVTLFQGGLGAEPMRDFSALGDPTLSRSKGGKTFEAYGLILGSLYVLITGVVLVNLLIAMMGSTYQTVKDNSDREFVFSIVQSRWRYDQSGNDLPPPLNLIAIALYGCMWAFYKVQRLIGKLIRPTTTNCRYCHTEFSEEPTSNISKDFKLTDSAISRFPSLVGLDFTNPKGDLHQKVVQLYKDGVICHCVRMKREVKGSVYLYERICVMVFAALILVPAWLISMLGLAVKKCIDLGMVARRWKQEEEEEEDEKAAKDLYADFHDPLKAFAGCEFPEKFSWTEDQKLDELLERTSSLVKKKPIRQRRPDILRQITKNRSSIMF